MTTGTVAFPKIEAFPENVTFPKTRSVNDWTGIPECPVRQKNVRLFVFPKIDEEPV